MLEREDPTLVFEPLIGYRLREKCQENIGEYKNPLEVPEILNQGNDVTLVTYESSVLNSTGCY